MSHHMTHDGLRKRQGGFSFVELLTTLIILGVLASISIPNLMRYLRRAEYVALQSTLGFLMDGEEAYFMEKEEFFPESGTISIAQGTGMSLPELLYSFPNGHRHRYVMRGFNESEPKDYRIIVFSDFDFNENGQNDQFIARINNGEREILQLQ